MWLHDNKEYPKPPSFLNKARPFSSPFHLSLSGIILTYLPPPFRSLCSQLAHINAYFMITAGAFIFVAGLYGSVLSIEDSFNSGTVGSPFSCAA